MLTAAQVLAENNFGDTRTGGLAGPMGLFLILVLATATVLLIRNMNARLRRLPDRFPATGTAPGPVRVEDSVVDPTDGTERQESRPATPGASQQG
ncbi:hypothetical protein [Micromonospora sp. DT233]|uniref:hypothetical protein n=1 Tax=Micromonospora sp. DT233 TaxID=3393432 RepID=UPI003CEE9C37